MAYYQQQQQQPLNENIPLTSIPPSEKTWKDEIPSDLEMYLDTKPLFGLTDAQVSERLAKFGKNELQEQKRSKIKHFLSFCKCEYTSTSRL